MLTRDADTKRFKRYDTRHALPRAVQRMVHDMEDMNKISDTNDMNDKKYMNAMNT